MHHRMSNEINPLYCLNSSIFLVNTSVTKLHAQQTTLCYLDYIPISTSSDEIIHATQIIFPKVLVSVDTKISSIKNKFLSRFRSP